MSKIDDITVDKIAELARLEFNAKDKEAIKKDLSKILTYIDKLNEIDTEGVKPLIHVSDEYNVLREDVIEEITTQAEALKNAPDKNSDYIKIAKVRTRS